jgi:beta-lactamase superfamily II metal-dependent hydrolase
MKESFYPVSKLKKSNAQESIDPDSEIVVLDVGHGNAAVVREGKKCIVIDAAGGSHVLEFLQEIGIESVDLVILSHSDKDHIDGLVALLGSGLEIKEVALNADAEKGSQIWDDIAKLLEDFRIAGRTVARVGVTVGNLHLPGFEDVEASVCAPSTYLAMKGAGGKDRDGRAITSNSISVCIKIFYKKSPVVLFAGDLDAIGLKEAVRSQVDLSASILVFPHHGGSPASGSEIDFTNSLLKAVNPGVVFFSMGRHKFMNPREDIVTAIKKFGAATKIACTQISKHCHPADQEHLLLAKFDSTFPFRISSSSCAGNIRVNLPYAANSVAHFSLHEKFVSTNLPNAICRAQ